MEVIYNLKEQINIEYLKKSVYERGNSTYTLFWPVVDNLIRYFQNFKNLLISLFHQKEYLKL